MFCRLNIIFISSTFMLCAITINAQHVVGVQRNAVAQNYKLQSNSNQRFEGYSPKQIRKEEIKNQKEQEKAKKELLKSHISKQTKATQKRMKASLKKSQRLLKGKSITPLWIILLKRKKAFSQRSENKYED